MARLITERKELFSVFRKLVESERTIDVNAVELKQRMLINDIQELRRE